MHVWWGTTVFDTFNVDHTSIKASLVEYCYDRLRRDGGGIVSGVAPHAKSNLYESQFDLFDSEDQAIQSLKKFCEGALRDSLKALAEPQGRRREVDTATITLHESWVHITTNGGHHDVHIHGNCSWCGIYYVDIGDCVNRPTNGMTEFYSPFRSTYDDFGVRLALPGDVVRVAPLEGKLVLFPSYVPHAAGRYTGKQDRIVIAFNARVNNGKAMGRS
jgi:uncharacterized protein (TIGR02466 family)